jgi:hypothetical protein
VETAVVPEQRRPLDPLLYLVKEAPSAAKGYRAVKEKTVGAYNYLFPESTDEDNDDDDNQYGTFGIH